MQQAKLEMVVIRLRSMGSWTKYFLED